MAGFIHGAILILGERRELRADLLLWLLILLVMVEVGGVVLVRGRACFADCLTIFASLPQVKLVSLRLSSWVGLFHFCGISILIDCAQMKLL